MRRKKRGADGPAEVYLVLHSGERVACLLESVGEDAWQATPVQPTAPWEVESAYIDLLPAGGTVSFVLEMPTTQEDTLRTVYRFPINLEEIKEAEGYFTIEMPFGTIPLHVAVQERAPHHPSMWALVDIDEKATTMRRFLLTGTGTQGHEPPAAKSEYIGTFQDMGFVWHVWEAPENVVYYDDPRERQPTALERIGQLASLARTALDDPVGLPEEELSKVEGEDFRLYAIECLDSIIDITDPPEEAA